MNFPLRKAKIVATLGPASSDAKVIAGLIEAGVNVFRLNFSHGVHKDHAKIFKTVRNTARELNKNVAIFQDLQGPKLRVGCFPDGIILVEKDERVVLRYESIHKTKAQKKYAKVIPYNYKPLAEEIKPGHRIYIDDGNIEIRVVSISGGDIEGQVVFGGPIKDHKGMNFPDTQLNIGSLTEKDKKDLLLGMQLGVDYVAVSFIRTADDVRMVRKFMQAKKKNIPIISKIEKAEAITNIQEILDETDSVMVARGDLAVEAGTPQVPILQKMIISECRKRGTPVITATQMLESMIISSRPTRAEASDIANAVLDGSDALMLSAETASGKYPIRAVEFMSSIIMETERKEFAVKAQRYFTKVLASSQSVIEAIESAASDLARSIGAKAIVCTTHTGQAARAVSKFRPAVPIVALSDQPEVLRRLALLWGVNARQIKRSGSIEVLSKHAQQVVKDYGLAKPDDKIVFTIGWPPLHYGTTNLLKVITVK